jgi:hypothetical protein
MSSAAAAAAAPGAAAIRATVAKDWEARDFIAGLERGMDRVASFLSRFGACSRVSVLASCARVFVS